MTTSVANHSDIERWGYEWGDYETMKLLEACEHFRVAERTLRLWVAEGRVFSTKIRRRVYVCTHSLSQYMRSGDE